MKFRRRSSGVLLLAVLSRISAAQTPDAQVDTTTEIGFVLPEEDHGGLKVTSGKTYNRVEGLPVFIGPTYRNRVRSGEFYLSALGIVRSAHAFKWDAENIGHRLTADLRFGDQRGFSIGAESFDLVSKIEPWQLDEPDGGLAAFFLKRDYFDYFGRHGARVHASAFRDDKRLVTIGYSHERWSSRRARDVFTLFRDDDSWRINPRINDGRVHLADIALHIDTRNSETNPLAGWFVNADYEFGSGDFATDGTLIPASGPDGFARLGYGRAFIDLRRYNRISLKRQLNGRMVLGGWLHGDPLPYQRRLSVGGVGTLPGFDFRRLGIGTDVGQCSRNTGPPEGRPAECERVALAQAEYRHELPSELFDVFNRNGIRVRGAVFRVRPVAVAFADAGRGWLVGPRAGKLSYRSGQFPGFDTFRTDVGLGLDLGIAGVYVAKAVSESKEPANFFVRIRNRF